MSIRAEKPNAAKTRSMGIRLGFGRFQITTAIIGAGMLIAMAACGSDDAGVSPIGQTVATPDIDATIAAQVQNAQVGIPTPTPVPASDRAAALEFAASHGAIARRWEEFHTEFDAWRQGLVSCSVNSVRSSLSGFAGEFAEIAASARALPRPEVTRGLSDTLVQAAGQELAALRLLRDTWQPGSAPSNAAGGQTLTNGSSTDSFSSGDDSGNDTQEELANTDGFNSSAANSPFRPGGLGPVVIRRVAPRSGRLAGRPGQQRQPRVFGGN